MQCMDRERMCCFLLRLLNPNQINMSVPRSPNRREYLPLVEQLYHPDNYTGQCCLSIHTHAHLDQCQLLLLKENPETIKENKTH